MTKLPGAIITKTHKSYSQCRTDKPQSSEHLPGRRQAADGRADEAAAHGPHQHQSPAPRVGQVAPGVRHHYNTWNHEKYSINTCFLGKENSTRKTEIWKCM